MLSTLFAVLFGIISILCLALAFFTWAASGMATGPRTIIDRVIVASALCALIFGGLSMKLAGTI